MCLIREDIMKIGILREGKQPPDKRVPFSPTQCSALIKEYPQVEWVIQKSPIRCYTDEEYTQAGIQLVEDVSDCDILLGIKEVPKSDLVSEKISDLGENIF